MSNFNVLNKASYNDYEGFLRTLAHVFEADYKLVEKLSNYDYLWRPDIPESTNVNYIQWLNLECEERCPIEMMFAQLFGSHDPYYFEPFEFTKEEKIMISDHSVRMCAKYKTMLNYLL